MIVYDPDEVTEFEIENVFNFRMFELLILEMAEEIEEAREEEGEDVSLMFDLDRLEELSQSITTLQTHCFYNEKPKLVKR
jgi:hypothetical protein